MPMSLASPRRLLLWLKGIQPWDEFQYALRRMNRAHRDAEEAARRYLTSTLSDADSEAAKYAAREHSDPIVLVLHRRVVEQEFKDSFESWKRFFWNKEHPQP